MCNYFFLLILVIYVFSRQLKNQLIDKNEKLNALITDNMHRSQTIFQIFKCTLNSWIEDKMCVVVKIYKHSRILCGKLPLVNERIK